MQRYASSAASAVLGALLAGVAFGAAGGSQLERTTWVEIAVVVLSGLLVATAVVRGPRGRRVHGGLTLAAFVGLAALIAISLAWSVAPNNSWLQTNLTLSYLAVFAAGLAIARLVDDGWAVVLRAVLLAATAVVLYAFATRVWPSLTPDDIFARLGAPYGYWNALAATAALAVPPALWLGARRSGHPPANALAYPLLSLFAVAIFLSYSRAAIVVAGVGALLWVAFVPLRLRSVTVLGVALAGAAPVIVWALQQDAFTENNQSLAVREAAATQFGLFLLATVVVMLGAGLAIGFSVARQPPRAPARLRLGAALGVVAVAVPIALFAIMASSDRGIGGTIEAGYESLTSTSRSTAGGPDRLLSASSVRGSYWRQAREVFDSHYWKGTGANSFGVTRLRFREREDQSISKHAHGYVHQTAADLGIAGLLASLALLVTWLIASGRAVGLLRRRNGPRLPWGAERVGVVALALGAVVYGLHSAVDWIWFVPGPTAMALLAAGVAIGRGPLSARVAAAEGPAAATTAPPLPPADLGGQAAAPAPNAPAPAMAMAAGGAPSGAVASSVVSPPSPAVDGASNGHSRDATAARASISEGNGSGPDAPTQELASAPPPPPPPPPPPADPPRRREAPRALRVAARPVLALLTIGATLLCAWAIWQPLRSDRETDRALDLVAEGKYAQAMDAADRAHEIDPLTPRPLLARSSIEDAAGRPEAALAALEDTVKTFPGDPQAWIQLSQYLLNAMNRPADALAVVRGALFLDPQSRAAQTVFFQASALLRPPAPPPPAAPAPAPAPAPPPASAPPSAPDAPRDPVKPPTGGAQPLPERPQMTPSPPDD